MLVSEILCQSYDFFPFILGQKKISFEQFKSDVQKYATAFSSLSEKSVILYIPDNLYLFYCCFMALLHVGKNVTLPASITPKNLEQLSKLKSIFITNQNLNIKMINPIDFYSEIRTPLKPIQNVSISFFTSGSTGTPKKIQKDLKTLVDEIQMHSKMQEKLTKQNPVLIATVMPNHMYGMLWRFLFPLCNQITQDLDTVISPEEIQSKQTQYSKVLLVTTPTFMNEIVAYDTCYCFSKNCLAVYSSGSLLTLNTSEKIYDLFGVSPFEIFGSTETGGVAYRQQKEGEEWHVFNFVQVEENNQSCIRVNSPFCFKNPYDMQDLIQLEDKERFILLGRNDRVVKIAENKVDLNEMESNLQKHHLIREVYLVALDMSKNLHLGGLICLNDQGKEKLKQNGKQSIIYDIKKYLSAWYDKSMLPKKYRFVNQIFKNQQGKILKDKAINLFHSNISEPVIKDLKYDKNKMSANMTFLKDSLYFQGHFPNYPILPGVIQLHFVFYFLKNYFHENLIRYTIQKLKFTNLILPDHEVYFKIEKTGKYEYFFCYKTENKMYSSGKIKIEDKNV